MGGNRHLEVPIGKRIGGLIRNNPGENVREFPRPGREGGPAALGLRQVLHQHADDRVADRAHDGRIVQRGRVGAQVAQPARRARARRRSAVSSSGWSTSSSPWIASASSARHRSSSAVMPDEEVVEQRAEPILDACRRDPRGTATAAGRGRRRGGARSRPGAGRASTGSSGTASPRCSPQAAATARMLVPCAPLARHQGEGGFEDAIALAGHRRAHPIKRSFGSDLLMLTMRVDAECE